MPNKKKHILNRILSITLVVMLATTTVAYTTYKTSEEVEAVALVDDGLFILMILGALGISYIGAQVESTPPIDVGDFTGDAQSDLSSLGYTFDEYQEKMYEDFGVPNPNDDFDPDNDDPNDKVPKWEKLKEWCKKNGNKLKVTAGGALSTVLGKVGYDMYQESRNGDVVANGLDIPSDVMNEIHTGLAGYPYVLISQQFTSDVVIRFYENHPYSHYLIDEKGEEYFNFSINGYGPKAYNITQNRWLSPSQYASTGKFKGMKVISANYKIYNSEAEALEAKANGEDGRKPAGAINSKSLPFSTDALDFIKSNPDADQLPVSENSRYPTEDEINKFLDGIRNPDFPGDTQPVINNFINSITKPPTGDPDQPVNPTPPVTPPVTPTPDPDITETPSPDTDITDADKNKFLLPESIKNKFPFCIPFDLIDSFTVLKSASRKAPKIELPLKSERYGIDYTISVDMSVYNAQAEILRTLELLIFIVSLIVATRSLIRG